MLSSMLATNHYCDYWAVEIQYVQDEMSSKYKTQILMI